MSTYLMHHGIKGQRRGVRRFQNEDGSLTAAGRSRIGRAASSIKSGVKGYFDTRKDQKAYEKDLKKRFKESRSEYRKARKEDSFFNRNKPGRAAARRAHRDAEQEYMKVAKEYSRNQGLKRAHYSTYDRAKIRKSDEQYDKDGKLGSAVNRNFKTAAGSMVKDKINSEVGKKVRGVVFKAAVGAAAMALVKRYYGKRADSVGLPGPVNNKARDIIDVLPNGRVKVSKAVENVTVDQVYEAVKDFAKDIRGK